MKNSFEHDQQVFGVLIHEICKLRGSFCFAWPLRCVYQIHGIPFQVQLQPCFSYAKVFHHIFKHKRVP